MDSPLKPTTTIEEHIRRLRDRGMEIDRDQAYQWLHFVSYYRLSAYWYPARKTCERTGRRRDEFQPGTRFSDVVKLYEADRKLRNLVYDGIERI